MFRPRVIPVLLLQNGGLVKTVRFSSPVYVGDPINAVKIFNDLEANELVFLDIMASKENHTIPLELVKQIGDEAFMHFSVGGGITHIEQAAEIVALGAEKVVLNTAVFETPKLVSQCTDLLGSQSVLVSIDVKKHKDNSYEVFTRGGSSPTGTHPVQVAKKAELLGAGEIMVNTLDRDGMRVGYDIDLIRMVVDSISIPVIACGGGAGSLNHLLEAYRLGHACALAAGSIFVFVGRKHGVLINYPDRLELEELFKSEV